jgi:hypothetical protein
VVPIEKCPLNAIEYFYKLLDRYPDITKVGFGLKIDDLPDYYPRKNEVIAWENQFWENELEPGIFKADIDTTFALYRPNTWGQQWKSALRTGFPYLVRHLPWYVDPMNLDVEEIYFAKEITKISTWYNT